MDFELLRALLECEATAGRLLELLEQDREDMPGCVSGELLAKCQQGTDEAIRAARAIREEARRLQML